MNILLVSIYDTSRSGGLCSHVRELAAGLGRAGHAARIANPHSAVPRLRRRLVADLPRVFLRRVDKDGAYLHFLKSSRRLLAGAIARMLHEAPAEVVHAHDPTALLAARDAVAGGGGGAAPRLILTVHGDIANMAISDRVIAAAGKGRRETEAFESEAYRSADAVIAVDGRLARHCRDLSGREGIERFANFVDVTSFRPPSAGDGETGAAIRRKLGIAPESRVLLATRRLVRKNGVRFAVSAMAEESVRSLRGSGLVLLVAGKGPQLRELTELADGLGLGAAGDRSVRFLGDVSHDELPELYRAVDGVLVPSIPDADVVEATSVSALEAMASGRVVIASAIGGLAELIEDGRTGFLVPPADPPALAAAVARVFGSSTRSGEIGLAARARVVEEHSTLGCVPRLLEIYGRAPSGPVQTSTSPARSGSGGGDSRRGAGGAG